MMTYKRKYIINILAWYLYSISKVIVKIVTHDILQASGDFCVEM